MAIEEINWGKFINMRKIAQGGMAEIFKAYAPTTGGKKRLVAIKRILPQYSRDEDFVTLLTDESKLMVTLNHPNIVPVIEFGAVDDNYYLALEYVNGKNLKDILIACEERKVQIPLEICAIIMREIAQGLDYAHRKKSRKGKDLNIIHRDISPTNVLISYQGEVKIVDFGIAKASSHSHVTRTGVIRGKMGYMSPEQTRSYFDIDARSDIYSAGILLFEMVTGEKLFSAGNINEAIKMVRRGDIPSPSAFRKELPPFLEGIILGALKQDVNERIQTAAVLRDMLNEFLAGVAVKRASSRVCSTDELAYYVQDLFPYEYSIAKKGIGKAMRPKLTPVPEKGEELEHSQPGIDGTIKSLATNVGYDKKILQARREQEVDYSFVKRVFRNKIFAFRPYQIYLFAVVLLIFMVFLTDVYIRPRMGKPVEGPPVTMRYARIRINSEPEGASVWFNGLPLKEKTPVDSINAPINRLSLVRLEKEGYKTEIISLNPEKTSGETVKAILEKLSSGD